MKFEGGSRWRRWNPHVHAPGTLLADNFENDWDGYLKAIETATPLVEVLGITDYSSIECYKAVKAHRDGGRLSKVKMIFPNVEFRLSVATAASKGINLHLMFCPDDDDHLHQIEKALHSLTFEFNGDPYHCSFDGLAELGKAFDPSQQDKLAACKVGANQFKVELQKFRNLFRNNKWVADNCLVGVASKTNDGVAGLQNDDGFKAVRNEIERFAHMIYCSNPKGRDFWLGKGAKKVKELEQTHGGRKPCIHGCDAHTITKTCKPDDDRYCWIKGDPTFESLRQTMLEPEERVFIGSSPPDRRDSSQCIASIGTRETPWIKTGEIPMNPGLVAIIGARGSGKTALADIIAVGADVASPMELDSSFIYRATNPDNYLDLAVVDLGWGDGEQTARYLGQENQQAGNDTVRYLSQQFVEQLCSARGMATALRTEIERVVFDATEDNKFNAESFDDLADIHLAPIRRKRADAQEGIENTSALVNAEDLLQNSIDRIKKEQKERVDRMRRNSIQMRNLIPKEKEANAARLTLLEEAVANASTSVEALNRAKVRIGNLREEVDSILKIKVPKMLENLKDDYDEIGLSPKQWDDFKMKFSGDVEVTLTAREEAITKEIARLKDGGATPANISTDPMAKWALKTLQAERDKAKSLVGLDTKNQGIYDRLQKSNASDEILQQKSVTELAHAEGAADRRKGHTARRRELYVEVFQTYLDEQSKLEELYAPLQKTLDKEEGSLKRLKLTVSREIDLSAWVENGEELIDLRNATKLRGRGALEREADRLLMPSWRTGNAEQVGTAMATFIAEMQSEIRAARPSNITDEDSSAWVQDVATWLYSTDHITMRYGITYDGVAIEHLSPGTRGIVLLLLYLVIDQKDPRPLIIDQPEENLDPKSVFDELVPHFRAARKRRQVIIVTHNANLVVNTDADQVIVASSTPNAGGGLPNVSYLCGSLEAPEIRGQVCEILEGGEKAFIERERRYRIDRTDGQELGVNR